MVWLRAVGDAGHTAAEVRRNVESVAHITDGVAQSCTPPTLTVTLTTTLTITVTGILINTTLDCTLDCTLNYTLNYTCISISSTSTRNLDTAKRQPPG